MGVGRVCSWLKYRFSGTTPEILFSWVQVGPQQSIVNILCHTLRNRRNPRSFTMWQKPWLRSPVLLKPGPGSETR